MTNFHDLCQGIEPIESPICGSGVIAVHALTDERPKTLVFRVKTESDVNPELRQQNVLNAGRMGNSELE